MSDRIINLKEIKKLIENIDKERVLIITGKNSFFKTGANKIFLKILEKKKFRIFFKNSYLPEFKELSDILEIKKNFSPNLIIAIGGGCSMDLAKITSVINGGKNLKNKLINSQFEKFKTKVLAIPTTAGSGAEVTSNAVIYINNFKYSVEGKKVKPNYYYLLPKLILSSGKKLDATAGFDAISQSIESIFSIKSNKESISYASKALKILIKNYPSFCRKKNLYNSYKMLNGANLAGKAISISKTIAPHAISYPFTSLFNIPHGHAVSLSLNKVLKFNFYNQNKDTSNNLKKKYDLIFKLTETKNIIELDNFLSGIKKKGNLTQNFRELKININNDLPKILKGVNNQRLKNNPIKLLKKDIPLIFKKY